MPELVEYENTPDQQQWQEMSKEEKEEYRKKPDVVKPLKAPTQQELINAAEKVQASKRRTKQGSKVVGKVDVDSIVKSLSDQIDKNNRLISCIGFIKTTLMFTDIPPDLEKPERDALLTYMKEAEAVQTKWIQQIQQL